MGQGVEGADVEFACESGGVVGDVGGLSGDGGIGGCGPVVLVEDGVGFGGDVDGVGAGEWE